MNMNALEILNFVFVKHTQILNMEQQLHQKIKYRGINLTKDMKDLYLEMPNALGTFSF